MILHCVVSSLAAILVSYYLGSLITVETRLDFVWRTLVCMVTAAVTLAALTWMRPEFREVMQIAFSMIRKKFGKKLTK